MCITWLHGICIILKKNLEPKFKNQPGCFKIKVVGNVWEILTYIWDWGYRNQFTPSTSPSHCYAFPSSAYFCIFLCSHLPFWYCEHSSDMTFTNWKCFGLVEIGWIGVESKTVGREWEVSSTVVHSLHGAFLWSLSCTCLYIDMHI